MSLSKKSSSGFVPYFEYHGIEPGAYYGMPYRQDVPYVGRQAHFHPKKSFASRLANQIDKLTGGGTLRGTNKAETSRPSINQVDYFRSSSNPTSVQKRTFHNLVNHHHSSSASSSNSGAYYRPWDQPQPPPLPHYIHPSHYADIEQTPPHAAKYCNCENFGTCRVKSSSRNGKCRNCGLDKGLSSVRNSGNNNNNANNVVHLRRTQSDESISNVDPYDLMRQRRMKQHHQKEEKWYEEDMEAYDEADYIYTHGRSSRKATPPRPPLRGHPHRRTSEFNAEQFSKRKQQQQHVPPVAPPRLRSSSASPRKTSSNMVTVNSSVVYVSPNVDKVQDWVEKSRHRARVRVSSGLSNQSKKMDGNDKSVLATTIEVGMNSGCTSDNFTNTSTEEEENAIDELEKVIDLESESSADDDDENEGRVDDDEDSSRGPSSDEEYDADCSLVESPRKLKMNFSAVSIPEEDENDDDDTFDETPMRGSLSKATSLGALRASSCSISDNEPNLGSQMGQRSGSRSRLGRILALDHQTKSEQLVERRQRQLDQDFRPKITKGFSNEILKEIYGSKSSLFSSSAEPPPSVTSNNNPANNNPDLYPTFQRKKLKDKKCVKASVSAPNMQFNDTTRLAKLNNRPSLNEIFQQQKNQQLGRKGISQSFKSSHNHQQLLLRPRDPPPPPPPTTTSTGSLRRYKDNNNKGAKRSRSFVKSLQNQLPKSFSYNSLDRRSGMKNIKKLLSNNNSGSQSNEHIYEEIPSSVNISNRPLPPLPNAKKLSTCSSNSGSSKVKSIFEGATKYDILHYLEDAKERGFTDVEIDEDEDDLDEAIHRHHANRSSQSSSSGSNHHHHHQHPVIGSTSTVVDIERNDSGLGSETGKPGLKRPPIKLRVNNNQHFKRRPPSENICEDCDQVIARGKPGESPNNENNEFNYDPSNAAVCFPCAKRRSERKETITEIVETEVKYGRDLLIIRDEFQGPMRVAGLLSEDQLRQIFLNVEALIENNAAFTEALKDAIDIALDDGDEDLCSVCIGKIFLKNELKMLRAFKSYCTRQGSASTLLAALEKDKELLRIFLRVSQMENTILRRMNLSSFLMVPVQRVTKYPLLLSRLLKVTPAHHDDRLALQESRERIEHNLEHMNQETRGDGGVGTTKLWRRISMINVASYKKLDSQLDILGNTTWGIRKMSLDVLDWSKENREEVNFVLESTLWFGASGDKIKMAAVSAILVTLGSAQASSPGKKGIFTTNVGKSKLLFGKDNGIRQAALLLIKEKNGRYSMVKDPLYLDKCVVCWEPEWEDSCFEIQDFAAKESFLFKAEDPARTQNWFRVLQSHALCLGGWRRRRNAMANIMISGLNAGRRD